MKTTVPALVLPFILLLNCGHYSTASAAAVATTSIASPDGPTPVTGLQRAEFESFDRLMLEFLEKNHVPGASLAVGRHGRLVYARGFGYADLANREPVQPTSLFRIASISKPITAVAILQLARQGKIRLNESVFNQLGLNVQGQGFDPRLQKVTVLNLLQHSGGWDRTKSGDPMTSSRIHAKITKQYGTSFPFDPTYVVKYMLDKPLDFEPGSRYAYSNFGYCLLGRLIVKVSGQSYENYVKQHVLAPLGIRRMQIGRSDGFQKDEVRYYSHAKSGDGYVTNNKNPVELYESHGGWIASAIELVRFAGEMDETVAKTRRGRRQIAGPEELALMFARPKGSLGYDDAGKPKPAYYGCGWMVRPKPSGRNIWHTGSIDGTAALLVRRHDGLCWAVLFNTRSNREGAVLHGLIDPLVHRAANAVPHWPDSLDLFAQYADR